ncbi:Nucleotide-diphospho-sugar transferase [Phytophthora cactorum]|nr:Nucleotide-diphospho-sugar transferase [Phytophthora cactorum]
MPEHGAGRKGTPLPIYVGGASGRHAPRKKPFVKRGSRNRSGDEKETSPGKRKGVLLTERRTWNLLWALFIIAFVICLVCLVTLGRMVQDGSISNNEVSGGDSTKRGLFAVWKENQVLAKLKRLSHMFTSVDETKVKNLVTRHELSNLGDYECVGWRQTTNCTPAGEREYENDKNCTELIPNGVSGYCEVRNTRTGESNRVLAMHCDSLRPGVQFKCDMFQSLLSYSILSTDYEHDPNFSYTHNQDVFRARNKLSNTPIPVGEDGLKNESVGQLELSFDRGIVFVIYEKLLLGAYVSVRSLRALGCTLPIEMWYKTSETNVEHPLLRLMVEEFGVYLRVIEDPLATHFYTKLYAIFYSAFDNVLLLDADNFAVRDPNYLFDTQEFVETGAIFWPDFWKPGNTIFNIHKNSYVWDFFGKRPGDDQPTDALQGVERAHVLRLLSAPSTRGVAARVGRQGSVPVRVAQVKSTFHMTPRPPGSAGTKHPDYDLFCGVTMVQHDPSGRVIFLHRNTEKLTYANNRILWTHIQQYKRTSALADYYVRGANGGKVFPQFKRCFGKDVHYEKLFTLKPMSAFPFENLEDDLLRFAAAGAEVLRLADYKEKDEEQTEETNKAEPGGRMQHNKMFAFFFLIVISCALGLICVASLIQQRDLQLQRLAVRSLHGANEHDANGLRGQMELMQQPAEDDNAADDLSNFECVGWKARRDCSPDGGPDPPNDRACNGTVHNGESGYCEIRHKVTGEVHQVMKMHCNSLRPDVAFKCEEFATFLGYGRKATEYVHDKTFSMENCRKELVDDQLAAAAAANEKPKVADGDMVDKIRRGVELSRTTAPARDIPQLRIELPIVATPPPSFKRGIVFVVYEKMLQSVYASVRSLRSMGCTLPVELWYKRSETNPSHPLLRELTGRYGAYVREIRDPRASKFYTKTYAVFYSAFDQVLLLDADNFAVRDPTYLFDTPQFQNDGAIFWPDFWRPKKTIFNIQPTSFVWEVFDLQPVDMFEQESGQVLINRKMHHKALNVLMYYAFNPSIFERLRLAWGDKDLFRFAWLKTGSSFHMIETPPGSAGLKLPDQNIFCGVTMVQHDPERGVVFLHRNQEKLSSENREKVWAHIQEFRMDEVGLDEYDVRGANGGRLNAATARIFITRRRSRVKAMNELPFAGLEQRLLNFVQEAARIDGTVDEQANVIQGEDVVDVADPAHQ